MSITKTLQKRKFLTKNEVDLVIKKSRTGPHSERNYCMLLLGFIHGLRASELCGLRVSDINIKDKCIHIHRLKNGFSTTHPLLEEEISGLNEWLKIRASYPNPESDWLFLSEKGNSVSRQQFYLVVSNTGVKANLTIKIYPHMLRHSCGFALANKGVDTRLIQDYLGHRNIRHTVWYTASNSNRFFGIWDRMREKIGIDSLAFAID